MIPLLDANTPPTGTPVSEWQRQVGNCCDGRVVHQLNNLLAGLVAIRYEAECNGWTPTLLASDRACETYLRSTMRHLRRECLSFCNVTKTLRPLHRYSRTAFAPCTVN